MRVLIAHGSKRGGTAGLAEMIGQALSLLGVEADVHPAAKAPAPDDYDGVIVAGALYANRWHRHARRYVRRRARALQAKPVWLVASGPLDDSARSGGIPPVAQVAALAARVGARGTLTFGGRLAPDAKGFPASAMAKTKAGDWRDPEQVKEFAAEVVSALAPAGHPRRTQ